MESYDNALKSNGGWVLVDRAQSDRIDRFLKARQIIRPLPQRNPDDCCRFLQPDDGLEVLVLPESSQTQVVQYGCNQIRDQIKLQRAVTFAP
jgi:hypothetical protein